MTQSNQRHLTIEQISVYLDQHTLTEEADAHLASCEHCQEELHTLQETVKLLEQLSQPRVPRSFALPLSTTQDTAAPLRLPSTRRKATIAKTLLRSASLLVAALGAIYLLTGLLTWSIAHPTMQSTASEPMTTSSLARSEAAPASTSDSNIRTFSSTPPTTKTPESGTKAIVSQTPISGATSTVPASPTSSVNNKTANTDQETAPAPALPAILDISTTAGKLALGIVLLIIGSIGIVLLKQRKKDIRT